MAISKLAADINLEKLPCTSLKGVGPKVAEKLEKLHIQSVLDLLFQDRKSVV